MTPSDAEALCRASFDKQQFMATLGARLTSVQPGEVVIEVPFDARLTQHHGHMHAGVITSIVDNACGFAALSLMPAGSEVLSVEFKINFMRPASAPLFRATGKVMRAGKTLSVCTGTVEAVQEQGPSVIAIMQATMIALSER